MTAAEAKEELATLIDESSGEWGLSPDGVADALLADGYVRVIEDGATVERLARAIYEDGSWQSRCPWDKLFESTREQCRQNARAVLRALRGGA